MVRDKLFSSQLCHLTGMLIRQNFMEFGHRNVFKLCKKNISRERSIFRKPPIYNFTENRRNMADTPNTYVCYFLGKYTDK